MSVFARSGNPASRICRAEQKVLDYIVRERYILFFFIISILGFLIRYCCRAFQTMDMSCFLVPWYEEIKANGGIHSLSKQVGDYNILYQTIIALSTYLPINCIIIYKSLSCIFDYILAVAAVKMVHTGKPDSNRFFLLFVYTVILFLPNIFLNSALWGQCDSIYVSICLLSLLALYSEKYVVSFTLLGLAFAFKLQSIFILPFYICVYFSRRSFSVSYFFIAVAVFWITGLAGFLSGRSLLDPFRIYIFQSGEYDEQFLNFHSFWFLLGNKYYPLKMPAILLTVTLCGLGLLTILSEKKKIQSFEGFINTACWFVWTLVLFLPAMHERYSYMLDILLVILSFLNIRYIGFALISNILTLITYGHYLFADDRISGFPGMLGSALYFISWVFFTVFIVKKEQIVVPNHTSAVLGD